MKTNVKIANALEDVMMAKVGVATHNVLYGI